MIKLHNPLRREKINNVIVDKYNLVRVQKFSPKFLTHFVIKNNLCSISNKKDFFIFAQLTVRNHSFGSKNIIFCNYLVFSIVRITKQDISIISYIRLMSKQKKIQFTVGTLALLLGGIIYIIFRNSKLIIFSWLDNLNLNSILILREQFKNTEDQIPDWIIFSLPDGLWIFSFITITLALWNNQITKRNVVWIFTLPLFILVHELLQLTGLGNGTFDYLDLIFYIAGTIIPFILYTNLFNFLKSKKL